jgi:16S rRNA (uracil1498-N3)-methyltransferase
VKSTIMTPASERGPRLFLAGVDLSRAQQTRLEIPAADSHHLRDVLRLRIGDPIEIADPASGSVAPAVITALTPLVTVELCAPAATQQRHGPEIHLLLALCKGQKNELVTDWATELGCASITLFQAERSIVRLKGAPDSRSKAERFEKIAWGAAEQSRQNKPPAIAVHLSLEAAIDTIPATNGHLRLWGSLSPGAFRFSSIVSDIQSATSVHLLIGPEGDLSPREEECLRINGFRPVSLGERVLRSELAAVTAIVSIQAAV